MNTTNPEPGPHWRMFNIRDHERLDSTKAKEIIRMHFMENGALSFGFVEQRVFEQLGLSDNTQWYLHCGDVRYERVPSLKHGMDVIEWVWNERERKES